MVDGAKSGLGDVVFPPLSGHKYRSLKGRSGYNGPFVVLTKALGLLVHTCENRVSYIQYWRYDNCKVGLSVKQNEPARKED